jgi:hypothetical protein
LKGGEKRVERLEKSGEEWRRVEKKSRVECSLYKKE